MDRDKKLERAIEDMDMRGGRSFSDLFSDFMDAALAMMCNNPSEHQQKLLQTLLVEIVRHDVLKNTESVPEDAEFVPEPEEIVPDEPQYDHLTATPKAVQLEFELF